MIGTSRPTGNYSCSFYATESSNCTNPSEHLIHVIIESFADCKPLTSNHFRRLCSGLSQPQEPLTEDSTQEMVFLKDQIQETSRFSETSVLEWDELPFETSSVRSIVSNSLLQNVGVVNVREGFYIQFDEVSPEVEHKLPGNLEDEKFVFR